MENRERKYWLHRITGGPNAWNLAHRLLDEKQLISIGWSDFSNSSFIADVKNEGIHAIDRWFKEARWNLSRNRYCLLRFIAEMEDGDIVIVPGYKSFSIYKIVGNNVLCNDNLDSEYLESQNYSIDAREIKDSTARQVDLGFYRRVEEIKKNVSKENFAMQKLSSRMKIRQTNSSLYDIKEELIETLENIKNDKYVNLKNAIVHNTEQIVFQQIQKIADSDRFEKLVEWYLESLGAMIIKTPSKNASPTEEGDADKVATFDKLRLTIIVQAKKHRGETNSWAVEQITNYKENNTNQEDVDDYTTLLWVISSAERYSEEAQTKARENQVRLIDGKEFARMIVENGVNNLPF